MTQQEQEKMATLEADNAQLRQDIKSLTEAVTDLTAKLMVLLNSKTIPVVKKNSNNSSLPPSSDLFAPKTKSLRTPSTLKSGGQPGHIGTTLEINPNPDEIIDLKDNFCNNCGAPLEPQNLVLKSLRQVIDIAPITPVTREYRQYSHICSKCQHEQVADFPIGVTAPVQYGPSIEALISYLSVYQYIPFARMQNFFEQVLSISISQGTIGNILERSAKKCDGVYQKIKTEIAKSEVVGSDETGAKVNGNKWWIWVWQNLQNTFIAASANRGTDTIENIWGDKLANVALVTDRWHAQLKTHTKKHQLCLAHLKRNLNFIEEAEKHPFALQFHQIINDIFAIRKQFAKEYSPAYKTDDLEAQTLEQRINELLLITIDKEKYHDTHLFQNSMLKHRKSITPCLYNLDIPPDNNGSERAIRNVKVKQKVSGQFKTGQNAFCILRSIIDTLRKRNVEVLPCLTQIFKLQPALPV